MRTDTERYNQGDRYTVYDGPGDIHYFEDYQSAADYQQESGGNLQEMS
jgi:hypothetical protein